MAGSLAQKFIGLGGAVRREIRAGRPVFLFFLIGFLLLLTLLRLTMAQFSIEIGSLSTVFVGALIAAKAALVMDETPLARNLNHHRRIVVVIVKTFCYGVAFLLVGYLDRLVEAARKLHSFGGAFQYVIAHANHDRLLAWALGISILFGLYFIFDEIGDRMGEGALWALFFESPGTVKLANQLSSRVVARPQDAHGS